MAIERVRYTDGQILQAADLTGEQTYRIGAYRRHLIGGHSWGILHGLRLRATPQGFVVLPGYAVDGYGRELILPQPIFTPWLVEGDADLFDMLGSDVFGADESRYLDVWLRSTQRPAAPSGGRAACSPEPPLRRYDDAAPCLSAVQRAAGSAAVPPVNAEAPPFLAERLGAPAPHLLPAAEPQADWPIFLGRLRRTGSGAYLAEHAGRPYAGLAGAAINSASHVAVAEDPANPPPVPTPPVPTAQIRASRVGTRRRVAVTIADAAGAQTAALALDTLSGVTIQGDTRLSGPASPETRDAANDLLIAPDPSLIEADDVLNRDVLAYRMAELGLLAETPLSARTLRFPPRLPAGDRRLPDAILRLKPLDPQLATRSELTQRLNALIAGLAPFDPARFAGIPLRPLTRRLLNGPAAIRQSALARRLLIEDLFPDELTPRVRQPAAYGVLFEPLAQPPAAAAPWRLCRVVIERDGQKVHQLRCAIGFTGEAQHPERNAFSVGAWATPAKRFRSSLTVNEAGDVQIAGGLVVLGDLIRQPAPTTKQGVLDQLAEQWGRGGGPAAIGQNALTVAIPGVNVGTDGTRWQYDVRVTNAGTAPANFISIMELLDVGGTFVTRSVATITSLAAGATETRTIRHPIPGDPPLTAGATLSVMLTVIGFDQAFNAIYASVGRTVTV
jgi:uncharacterized repeat protein (TIGR01451 family)